MPQAYRNVPVITVSESSRNGIAKIGLAKSQNIAIVSPGVDIKKFKTLPKTRHPSFIYLGRVQPYKNIDVAISAMAEVVKAHPAATLTIAGTGEDIDRLKQLTAKLSLTDHVHFLGRVLEDQKPLLLSSHWAMIQPSSFEGWGITVIEANASGTPVIASDVVGLRDSVVNNYTGLLFPARNATVLSQAMLQIITQPELRKQLAKNSLVWSRKFLWDNQAQAFMAEISSYLSQIKYPVNIPNPALAEP